MGNWRTVCLTCVFSAVLTHPGRGEGKLKLTKSGETAYVISLAKDAAPSEQTAARELADHLQKATGVEFQILSPEETRDRYLIAVGPEAAKVVDPGLDLRFEELGHDGIIMRTQGPCLILSGADGAKRGTLYAVYEFLESAVGVRWWTPTEADLPSISELCVPEMDVRYTPSIRYREVFYRCVQHNHKDEDGSRLRFAARLRNNGHHTQLPADWGGCYQILGWCHTFERLLPPEEHFESHPDWYSELDGKRTAERSQLCCTNDEMIDELTKSVLSWLREDPEAGIISVSQNDWRNNCQCAQCRAMDEKEGSPAGSLLYCVNRVAEAMEKEFPDFLISTLAYQYTRKPPKTIRPRHNVVIRLAVIERSAVQPIEHEMNSSVMDDLTAWSEVAPNLAVWDYVANMKGPFTPHPNLPVLCKDIKLYRDHHVISAFMQGNSYCDVGDFDELKVYLMSHLLWDPSRDPQAIIDEFLEGYYGKAAPAIASYLDLIAGEAEGLRFKSWSQGHDAAWMDLSAMNKATRIFREAEKRVAKDPVRLERVKRSRLQLDHQWLRGHETYRGHQRAQGLDSEGPSDVIEATEEFIARCKSYGVDSLTHPRVQFLDEYAEELRRRSKRAARM